MTAASYLVTPKPTHECHQLPVCPPPPRVIHQPISVAVDSELSPSLNFPRCLRNHEIPSSRNARGSFLTVPGILTNQSSARTNKPFLAKRSQATKPLPPLRLKPRLSKYTAPMRPSSSLLRPRSKTNLQSMTRSPSYQQLIRSGNIRSSLPRRPSFSSPAA